MSKQNGTSGVRAWEAEGARVGLVTCKTCGAALLLDPANDFNVFDLHNAWHERIEGGAQR